MSSLRGQIIGITMFDVDGNPIGQNSSMPVERVALLLDVNYLDGDLRQMLGHSLAIVEHGKTETDLARMTDQRAARAPSRFQLLEIDDNAPALPTDSPTER